MEARTGIATTLFCVLPVSVLEDVIVHDEGLISQALTKNGISTWSMALHTTAATAINDQQARQ